jgi:polysaccharide export outer membrane protein
MVSLKVGRVIAAPSIAALLLSGCVGGGGPQLQPAPLVANREGPSAEYIIGPSDTLSIFVWQNVDLSAKNVQVRPDGRITTPLINDMPAVGKTPAMLADDMRYALSEYIKNPIVSVIVESSAGTTSQQIRIVGATAKPAAIPYRANMTVLDAMIAVGGLSEFASGNRARLVRVDNTGHQREYRVRLGDLLKNGDTSANVKLEPGDVIIIPESMF